MKKSRPVTPATRRLQKAGKRLQKAGKRLQKAGKRGDVLTTRQLFNGLLDTAEDGDKVTAPNYLLHSRETGVLDVSSGKHFLSSEESTALIHETVDNAKAGLGYDSEAFVRAAFGIHQAKDLSKEEKKRRLEDIQVKLDAEEKRKTAQRMQEDAKQQIAGARGQLAVLDKIEGVLLDFREWSTKEPFRLEKNECSRVHKLIGYLENGLSSDVLPSRQLRVMPSNEAHPVLDLHTAKPFVVRHDWAAVFSVTDSPVADAEETRLPFPEMVFEFKVSGRTVLAYVTQKDGEPPDFSFAFFEAANTGWVSLEVMRDGTIRTSRIYKFLELQIRAICVMLDAKVAESSVVEQPKALNAKRLKAGKQPLRDFYIIDLSARRRAAVKATTAPGSTGRHHRLHFRRGHWVHFHSDRYREDLRGTRKWVKWMLVGDPDFGFVDKVYTL